MAIKDRLRELRSKSKESLQQVADAVGVSKAHIWELETGRSTNPSLEILRALSAHFKVTVAFLADENSMGESRAHSFFRRNEKMFQRMTNEELDFIEELAKKLNTKKP